MTTAYGFRRSWVNALCLLVAVVAAPSSYAQADSSTIRGIVIDVFSGNPVKGSIIRIAATGEEKITGEDGSYYFNAPHGMPHILEVEAPGYHKTNVVKQNSSKSTKIRLLPLEISDPASLHSNTDQPIFGVPWHRSEAANRPGKEIKLFELASPLFATMPKNLPETIRVGRRFTHGCAVPVAQIEEISLEDYVAGVVPAEIGVFRAVPGGSESARTVFEAFSILARSYALWWYLLRGEDAAWHIDDTSCEQRYSDERHPWITEVAMSTAGQVLVNASDPTIIDKYEYAASCGRHGTLPAYETEILPDETPGEGCLTNGWCGHDSCAGHANNPDLEEPNKCLIRGVCQWGALERSLHGHSKDDILNHYQKNLTILTFPTTAKGNLIGAVKAEDLVDGAPIQGAHIMLDTGDHVFTDERGVYLFSDIVHGTYEIMVDAAGFLPDSRQVTINKPGDHWASFALLIDESVYEGSNHYNDPNENGGPGDLLPPTGGCTCSISDQGDSYYLLWPALMVLLGLLVFARKRSASRFCT